MCVCVRVCLCVCVYVNEVLMITHLKYKGNTLHTLNCKCGQNQSQYSNIKIQQVKQAGMKGHQPAY